MTKIVMTSIGKITVLGYLLLQTLMSLYNGRKKINKFDNQKKKKKKYENFRMLVCTGTQNIEKYYLIPVMSLWNLKIQVMEFHKMCQAFLYFKLGICCFGKVCEYTPLRCTKLFHLRKQSSHWKELNLSQTT